MTMKRADGMALLALQGPMAAAVMGRLSPDLAKLAFMSSIDCEVAGIWMHISRTGYTGEDGYEISLHAKDAVQFWDKLRADADVQPIGLGARDSLRLEAGLCLYGHDIDTTTSPIEAGLAWSIQKRRREEGGFPGAARIQAELKNGPSRRRVGIRPDGAAPAREGAEILSANGAPIGKVTSGGPSPCLANKPIAMGYVATGQAAPGTKRATCRARQTAACRNRPHALRPAPVFQELEDVNPRDRTPIHDIHGFGRSTMSHAQSLSPPTGTPPMIERYTKDHEYIRVDGDVGTVGITTYAQEKLGDVVFVEVPTSARSWKPARKPPSSRASKPPATSMHPSRAR